MNFYQFPEQFTDIVFSVSFEFFIVFTTKNSSFSCFVIDCLRICKIRKTLGYTQQQFAEGLKISKAHVGAMELNNRKVPERIIKMICFTYGVNEKWLKTGNGDMFEKDKDLKLEEVIDNFNKLDELLQDYVLKQIRLALEFQEKTKGKE